MQVFSSHSGRSPGCRTTCSGRLIAGPPMISLATGDQQIGFFQAGRDFDGCLVRARRAEDVSCDAMRPGDQRAYTIARLELHSGGLIGGHAPDLAGSFWQQRLWRRIGRYTS